MKKTLLIVISLILASLLLVVACDDKSGSVDPENPSIVIPVVPEGAPSLDEDDLKEITEEPVEPKDEDIILISTLTEELQKFVAVPDEWGNSDLSEEAWEIVYDLLNAVGEQGIELKGEGYSLAATFDFEKQSLTASGSFNKFVFDKFTFDGSVLFTVSPNKDYNSSERFTITSDEKTNLTITIDDKDTTYKDVKAVLEVIMDNYGESLSDADMKSLIDAANNTIPGLVEAVNNFIKNYTIKTDLLTLILNGNVKGLVTLSDSGFDFGEGIEVSANASTYTNKPIAFNGSQYKVFVSGNADATIDNNPEYDPYYDPYYEGDYDPAKYAPVEIKFEGAVNLVLETSGKIGSQKVRFHANVSGSNLEDEPKVQVYAVINDRVIDINALIENAE